MSRIRGKHTNPERKIKSYLKSRRRKFKQHFKIDRYCVDFVLPGKKLAVFVDGCFWHACPKCFRKPKSNLKYWNQKLKENVARDKRINRAVRKRGWKTLHIWEHQIKNESYKRMLR
jgi:DNA mismatch endonuclease (patch repair protein)